MADTVKEAKFALALDGDMELKIRDLIAAHHDSLDGAKIALLWALDKEMTFWGRAKTVPEDVWLLTADTSLPDSSEWTDGVDITIQINRALWRSLSDRARLGLLDVLLSTVARKEGGKTEQRFYTGQRRTLYQVIRHTLGVDPAVLARNPDLVREVSELKALRSALAEPEQYLLALGAESEDEEELDGEDQEDGEDDEDEDEGAADPLLAGQDLGDDESWGYHRTTVMTPAGPAEIVAMFEAGVRHPDALKGVYVVKGGDEKALADPRGLPFIFDVDFVDAYRSYMAGASSAEAAGVAH